jgi:hypothetical protein
MKARDACRRADLAIETTVMLFGLRRHAAQAPCGPSRRQGFRAGANQIREQQRAMQEQHRAISARSPSTARPLLSMASNQSGSQQWDAAVNDLTGKIAANGGGIASAAAWSL